MEFINIINIWSSSDIVKAMQRQAKECLTIFVNTWLRLASKIYEELTKLNKTQW